MASTGKTQGIRLRIRPPPKANSAATSRPIGAPPTPSPASAFEPGGGPRPDVPAGAAPGFFIIAAALLAVLAALALAPLPSLTAQSVPAPTVVIIVRHADKATTPPSDPPLTAIGTGLATAIFDPGTGAMITARRSWRATVVTIIEMISSEPLPRMTS